MPWDTKNETSTGQSVTVAPAASNDPGLSAGARHHAAGKFHEAERLYRRVLQRNPNNADTLNLLGVFAAQVGHLRDALGLER